MSVLDILLAIITVLMVPVIVVVLICLVVSLEESWKVPKVIEKWIIVPLNIAFGICCVIVVVINTASWWHGKLGR